MIQNAISKVLVQAGMLLPDDVEKLSRIAQEMGESFITTAVKNKKLDYTQIALYLAKKFSLPYLDLDVVDVAYLPTDIDLKLLDTIKVLPLRKDSASITVALSDPTNHNIANDLKFQSGVNKIIVVVVEENKLGNMIAKYMKSRSGSAQEYVTQGLLDDLPAEEEKVVDSDVEDAPLVRFIHAVLVEAIKMKVSDIHFEPYEKTYRIRYRLDGVLTESKKIPPALREKIASRIKVMSSMDISEKRMPQDGRFKFAYTKEKSIDFRVSSLPTLYGEKIVMRILDSSIESLDINKLGYSEKQKEQLLDAIKRPYGMVLVTGPTGSGKTVSLYSCINLLNNEGINICTAEDPAEMNLPGVNQVNINERAGLTFATALRSFLRQDPDTILVGEIRDLETADIAIKAAQTGHMVLSTLHTNDAPKTITRLLNMGVQPFNVASSVILITAQRLARKLCPHCKKKEVLPPEVLIQSGMLPEDLEGYGSTWHTYRPVGCSECNEKGYTGRTGIYQVMPVTEEMRKIILREGTDIEIAMEAKRNGVYTLREAGMKKVKEGVTSLEEILTTTNLE